MDNKKCCICTYFPCLKFTCNIGNKQGCDEFKSIVTNEIEKIDKKIDKE